MVWIDRDGDTTLFSIRTGQRKATNLRRDPRVSLTAYLPENPYHTVEIRGVAELTPDENRALFRRIWRKYLGEDPPPQRAAMPGLVVRIHARRLNFYKPE